MAESSVPSVTKNLFLGPSLMDNFSEDLREGQRAIKAFRNRGNGPLRSENGPLSKDNAP